MTDRELEYYLELTDPAELQKLYDAAYQVKLQHVGALVSLRGLVEISNICSKNCYYCGIRRGNAKVERYSIDRAEIVQAAVWAHRQHYGSICLQAGEIASEKFTAFIEDTLHEIGEKTGDGLGITLSLGEQSEETYRRWREAGARRYLLRIESSDPEFYRQLHPADHSFDARLECLKRLRRCGYQVGTGVMIGLPGQTTRQLVGDLRFFEAFDIDMIGMGPYIPHEDTPLGKGLAVTPEYRRRQLTLGLKMIACARLLLRDVNIAATTALQALTDDGREQGLRAGANILMPNITEVGHRRQYQLYAGKPCLEETPEAGQEGLLHRVASVGERINWDQSGDSPHFFRRR